MLIFLQSKIQPIRAVLSVVCLIVSSYATNAYAEISDMRADLKSVNEQIFRALTVRGELTGDVPDAEVIKELRVFIATLPEDQVAKALVDAEHGLASLEKEIAILKASPSLSDDANGREVEALRSEFYDVYSKCSNTFNKYKKISLIFKSSPCSEYEERVEARIWNVDTPQKKIEAYQEGIATLTKIMTQMAELDTTELGRMYEKIKSFNAQHKKLGVLLAKRENLKSDISAILENMDEYQSKAESYMANASLNCAAEPVDFDCGNRCQQRVKDPIFGTYRNEPDMRCLKKCNFQEQQAIADLNEKIDDCIDDRDWAKEKLEGIESDYDSERARGLALSREHNQINDDLKLLLDRNKNAVGELDSFLAQLPPEIFNTMSNEFSAYGLNSMSYRTD